MWAIFCDVFAPMNEERELTFKGQDVDLINVALNRLLNDIRGFSKDEIQRINELIDLTT